MNKKSPISVTQVVAGILLVSSAFVSYAADVDLDNIDIDWDSSKEGPYPNIITGAFGFKFATPLIESNKVHCSDDESRRSGYKHCSLDADKPYLVFGDKYGVFTNPDKLIWQIVGVSDYGTFGPRIKSAEHCKEEATIITETLKNRYGVDFYNETVMEDSNLHDVSIEQWDAHQGNVMVSIKCRNAYKEGKRTGGVLSIRYTDFSQRGQVVDDSGL